MCGAVSPDLSAFFAFMDDDISLSGVGLDPYGAQYTAAIAVSVSGIHINMKRTKAERAMIAGAVTEGLNSPFAIHADKGIIVFAKTFFFHSSSITI